MQGCPTKIIVGTNVFKVVWKSVVVVVVVKN